MFASVPLHQLAPFRCPLLCPFYWLASLCWGYVCYGFGGTLIADVLLGVNMKSYLLVVYLDIADAARAKRPATRGADGGRRGGRHGG